MDARCAGPRYGSVIGAGDSMIQVFETASMRRADGSLSGKLGVMGVAGEFCVRWLGAWVTVGLK